MIIKRKDKKEKTDEEKLKAYKRSMDAGIAVGLGGGGITGIANFIKSRTTGKDGTMKDKVNAMENDEDLRNANNAEQRILKLATVASILGGTALHGVGALKYKKLKKKIEEKEKKKDDNNKKAE